MGYHERLIARWIELDRREAEAAHFLRRRILERACGAYYYRATMLEAILRAAAIEPWVNIGLVSRCPGCYSNISSPKYPEGYEVRIHKMGCPLLGR